MEDRNAPWVETHGYHRLSLRDHGAAENLTGGAADGRSRGIGELSRGDLWAAFGLAYRAAA